LNQSLSKARADHFAETAALKGDAERNALYWKEKLEIADARLSKLGSEAAETIERIRVCDSEREELRRALYEARTSEEALTTALDRTRSECDEARSKIDSLRQANEAKDKIIDEMSSELSGCKFARDAFEEDLQRLRLEMSRLQSQSAASLKELNGQLQGCQIEISELKGRAAVLQDKCTDAIAKREAAEAKGLKLQAILDARLQALTEKTSALAAAQAQIEELNERLTGALIELEAEGDLCRKALVRLPHVPFDMPFE
jgi:chromosome segregation ATPase